MQSLDGNCILDFVVNACLRSVGQVVFCNNPLSGFGILVALWMDDRMWGPAMCKSQRWHLTLNCSKRSLCPTNVRSLTHS